MRDRDGVKSVKAICSVTIFGILCASSSTWARKVEEWSYDRLFREADLVVIAVARSFAAARQEWPEKVFAKDRFEGVETIFHASRALKGDVPQRIHLLHFKYTEHARPYEDGPGLVSFFLEPISIDVTRQDREEGRQREPKQKRLSVTGQPEYLLFLKKRKDGLYEAVSGQRDPVFSVRALFELPSLK